MIRLNNLSLQFGDRYILRDASASIAANDRIGLVGSNGAGKTTLLNILAGLESADSGEIDRSRNATVGYLPQDGIAASGRTLYKEAESIFEEIVDLASRVESANERIQSLDSKSAEYRHALEEIGAWEQALEDMQADKLPARIASVLHGLGFQQSDMERETGEFSGGWQMRIALAKLLLASPALLLLDEPTNHLDLSSQRWLEKYLRSYPGALLMVSHDRAFLDELCLRTFELSRGNLTAYRGGYSDYERQSRIQKEQQVRSYKNQKREIERSERFIERFRYKASKARQAQSRIKALDKIERIEIEDDEETIAFAFPPSPRSGQVVLELNNVSKSYGSVDVLKNASICIERGDRIAVVGVNGSGKSTLAKIMAGVEPFQSGIRKPGHNSAISYFAQHQADTLDPSLSVLETLEFAGSGQNSTQLRSALGAFLFHGDDVFKKTRVLSGGERNRLALAKILIQRTNFLILDEPTNHLDMRSQEALRNALASFGGSFLIVSHNRAFVDGIVTKTLEISSQGLAVFPGNVSEFLRHSESRAANPADLPASAPEIREPSKRLSPKERRQKRAALLAELGPMRKRRDRIEKRIAEIEASQKKLEEKMSNPEYFKTAEAKESAARHQKDQLELESLYDDWSQVEDELSPREAEIEKLSGSS